MYTWRKAKIHGLGTQEGAQKYVPRNIFLAQLLESAPRTKIFVRRKTFLGLFLLGGQSWAVLHMNLGIRTCIQ